MAEDLGQTFGGMAASFGVGAQVFFITIIIITIAVIILGLIIYYFWNKKRWNLKMEIKLVRSNGEFVGGEWGKGMYDSKRGFVYIKRPGIRRKFSMKVFDIRKYLQGSDLLTVIQLGPEDFRPVLMSSFTKYIREVEDKDGNPQQVREAVINIKIDKGDTKQWRQSFESAAKKAYTLQSFIQQFQVPIAIAIVLISSFIGFTVLWMKLGSVCGK
jgi:hypothetical protein